MYGWKLVNSVPPLPEIGGFTVNGLAVPVVDELATATLDVWAEEAGYVKIQPKICWAYRPGGSNTANDCDRRHKGYKRLVRMKDLTWDSTVAEFKKRLEAEERELLEGMVRKKRGS